MATNGGSGCLLWHHGIWLAKNHVGQAGRPGFWLDYYDHTDADYCRWIGNLRMVRTER